MMRLFLIISTLVISSCTTRPTLDIGQYPDFDYQNVTISAARLNQKNIPDLTSCQADLSCASASISTVIKRKFETDISEVEVMSGLFNYGKKTEIEERNGFSLLDMKLYVESLGYQGNGFMLDRGDFIQIFKDSGHSNELPIIVPVNYAGTKRYVVLSGANNDFALIDDSAYGRYKIQHNDFFDILDEEVIFTINKAQPEP